MTRHRQARLSAPHKNAEIVTFYPPADREEATRTRTANERQEKTRGLEEELAAARRALDQVQRSLYAAEHLQRRLCGPRELRRGAFQIATEIFPVRSISGDFYDVLELGGALGLAVGDIAGKDVAAGLWYTHLRGLLRLHAQGHPDPGSVLAAVNQDLFRVQAAPPTASLFLGWLDPRRGELVYCHAGHPPSLLLRREGRVETLRQGGALLGALPGARFETGRVTMEPGDTLIAYSDGITESRNDAGEDFGAERLLRAGRRAADGSAPGLLFSVLAAVQDFAGSRPREDDFALMVIHRRYRSGQ